MTKNDFLSGLDYRLKKLPWEERQNAIHYYMEYFDDAGRENEQKVLQELGSPQAVAAQIMSDYAIKGLDSNPVGVKKGLSTLWVVILAIFATPIALPIAIAFAALLLSVFAVLFSLVAVGGALIIAGIVCVLASFMVILQSFPTTMVFAGGGLVVTGIGILILLGMIALCKGAFILTSKIFKRFSKKNRKNKDFPQVDYAQNISAQTVPQNPENSVEGVVLHDEEKN